MGKLTNLNPPKALTESDLPGTMSTDAEVTAALAAHLAAADPHLQYPTQSRGDARYIGNDQGLVLKIKEFTGMTDSAGDANFPHQLDGSKISRIDCLINGFPPAYMAASFGGTAEYNIFHTLGHCFVKSGLNNTSIKNQSYKFTVIYKA